MTEIELAKQEVQDTYIARWGEWYRDHSGLAPAKLLIEETLSDSGYRISMDEIHLNLPEANLLEILDEDLDQGFYRINEPLGWNTWKRELIHEMLHEYQSKIVKGEVTQEGRVLMTAFGKTFGGHGHDEAFFTAVAIISSKIGLAPKDLMDNL